MKILLYFHCKYTPHFEQVLLTAWAQEEKAGTTADRRVRAEYHTSYSPNRLNQHTLSNYFLLSAEDYLVSVPYHVAVFV